MALISDPQVVKFSNEHLRPRAEDLVRMEILLQSMKTQYDSVIAALISGAAGGDIVDDGREAQGVSRVTKDDLVNLMNQVNAALTAWQAAGVPEILQKPTVRAPSVS